MAHISDIKLIRTDTTRDLSQKACCFVYCLEHSWKPSCLALALQLGLLLEFNLSVNDGSSAGLVAVLLRLEDWTLLCLGLLGGLLSLLGLGGGLELVGDALLVLGVQEVVRVLLPLFVTSGSVVVAGAVLLVSVGHVVEGLRLGRHGEGSSLWMCVDVVEVGMGLPATVAVLGLTFIYSIRTLREKGNTTTGPHSPDLVLHSPAAVFHGPS